MASAFERIPRELRDAIYKLCLPVGKELVLKATPCEKDEIRDREIRVAPFPALLQVNQSIRAEAGFLFYRRNTWRIIDAERLQLPTIFEKYVRKATVTFDRRIFKFEDFWSMSEDVMENRIPARDRLDCIHSNMKERLLEIWTNKCLTLAELRLQELTMDFEHCVCPLGCCRMVEDVVSELHENEVIGGKCEVTAMGMVFENEAELLHLADVRCYQCEGPTGGTCWRSALDEDE